MTILLLPPLAILPAAAATAASGSAAPAAPVSTSPAPALPGTSGDQLAEVVVTALKHKTNIQQTPLAITAVDARQLSNQ
ncbi:MAG TPA: hypothetical protein VND24_08120, partial [Steroidobacteraceae bacterium]|nr:hypothetical protein [Steroidobacteraceae bacterium]